jgi:hypothetical protein
MRQDVDNVRTHRGPAVAQIGARNPRSSCSRSETGAASNDPSRSAGSRGVPPADVRASTSRPRSFRTEDIALSCEVVSLARAVRFVGNRKNLLVLSFAVFDPKEKSTRFSNCSKTDRALHSRRPGQGRMTRVRWLHRACMSAVTLEAKWQGHRSSREGKKEKEAGPVLACHPEG